jgi:amino acid permease
MLNLYIGIALIALPKAVSEVGFIAAFVGLLAVNFLSLGASYFLLKARNRFKKQRIIDFPDMANVTYGPMMKRFSESILILANTTFVMAQGMYLGGQADLFACNWFARPDECGENKHFYSFVMVALMSPLLLIPDFKKLSAYSSFFIACCVTSIICILGFEIATIYKRGHGESVRMTYSDETGKVVVASEEKLATAFDYEFFNFSLFPLFMGEVMSVFEGNVGMLNIYSQQNEPRTMFRQTVITHLTVGGLCLLLGGLSYFAYGNLTQDIVLYNLP